MIYKEHRIWPIVMVFRLGMSDRVGPLSYVKRERSLVGKQTTAYHQIPLKCWTTKYVI